MPTTPAAETSPGTRSSPHGARLAAPWTALLGLPLFWKIILANLAVVAVGTTVGAVALSSLGELGARAVTGGVALMGLAVLVAGICVNVLLVRLALSPLEDLQRTAEAVQAGRLAARSPASRFSDRKLHHLVSAFNEMLDAVDRNRERQQELARRVLEAEERERERVAHELYSRTAQTLAAILVRLRLARGELDCDRSGALDEIRAGVVEALEEIRGVARRLRPPELDELGVQVALEAHARSLTEGSAVEVSFEGTLPELDREASLALFRIVQEAITNAVLHGGPDSVRVSFRTADGRLTAEVRDDGVGFDLERALRSTSESLGLFGMHERAGYLEGELSLESGPGSGTAVRVSLPLERGEAGREALDGAVERLVDGMITPRADAAAPPVIA